MNTVFDHYGNIKQPKDIMRTNDILGTQPATFTNKVTMKTHRRQVNPLDPEYVLPGHQELEDAY